MIPHLSISSWITLSHSPEERSVNKPQRYKNQNNDDEKPWRGNVAIPRTFDFSVVNSTAPTPVHVLSTAQVLNLVP